MKFNLFNIPVHIHPTFWLFLLFFTNIYMNPSIENLILGGILIVSLLVHELGHALTALSFGAKPTIILEAFGGRAEYKNLGMSSKQEFFITMNGPLLESLLIFLSYWFLKSQIFADQYYMQYTLYATMRLNILWCLFNLLPISPLDGGHLLRYLLERKFGQKGEKVGIMIAIASVVIAAPYYFSQGLFFFGGLLLVFGWRNVQSLQQIRIASGETNPLRCYLNGIDFLENNELEKAKTILKKLLKSKDKQMKYRAVEALAEVYIKANMKLKAYDLLLKSEHQYLKKGKCLLCELAFERGNYALVKEYSQDIYEIEPSFEIALLNSKAFAYLGKPVLAGGWLETASLFGEEEKKKIAALLEHETYDFVKEHDAFRQFVRKIEIN